VRLHYDEQTEAFRRELRAWMEENLPPASERAERVTSSAHIPPWARAWQRKLFDNGWLVPGWPPEYGGRNATPVQQMVYFEELANLGVPRSCNPQGLSIITPSILDWGTEEQKARFALPTLRAEISWCLGMSEPNAGSDLAGLRTRAELHGDRFVVNGQKVWTSGAHYSDYGIVITRTDPNVPKHAGLTMFFLSMKTPGVEVRPIKQMSGGANFNEVFFTDVRIPDSQRLGKVGEGWKAALTTLMNERLAVGLPSGGLDVDELMELARDTDLEDGPAIKNQQVRGKIADWYVQQQGLKLTRYRTLTALSKGQTPGPESSIIKIVAAPKMQDMGAFAMELMGPAGIMKEDVPHAAGFQAQWIGGAGFRIAGGTDEILRNIVAERVLGLPADIRVDKDIPFNKLGKS
jgi:alkylation response protein AidB-like acyl-CoA dehydrogenase